MFFFSGSLSQNTSDILCMKKLKKFYENILQLTDTETSTKLETAAVVWSLQDSEPNPSRFSMLFIYSDRHEIATEFADSSVFERSNYVSYEETLVETR